MGIEDLDLEPEQKAAVEKLLAEENAKASALEAELAKSQRLAALTSVGIDINAPLGKFFVENYKGEITDPEAIKAAATELGVPMSGSQIPQEPPVETGTDERRSLQNGGVPLGNEDPDPKVTAKQAYDNAIAAGHSTDRAMGAYFHTVAEAGFNRGDKRVLL